MLPARIQIKVENAFKDITNLKSSVLSSRYKVKRYVIAGLKKPVVIMYLSCCNAKRCPL
jgi:hypothetical protein